MALPKLGANYINYGNGTNTGYFAVTAWATGAVKAVGALVRATAPSVGNERVRVCIVAGTTHATTEPTWTTTRGAKNTDNTVTWQECTGQPATNGDLTNTLTWTASKAQASTPSLGVIVKDASNNLFICTTSGAVGAGEPTWDTTVGNTTTDSSATWTCIHNGAFAAWAAPHARIANACAANWGASGDDFYVADNHAETQSSSLTITLPGTGALPNRLLCVNHSGSMPPVAADLLTTASVATTGFANISLAGNGYIRGIIFSAGTGSGGGTLSMATGSNRMRLDCCALNVVNTAAGGQIFMGSNSGAGGYAEWINTTVSFANAAQTILARAIVLRWLNTPSAIAGTTPTTLFAAQSGTTTVYLHGVDLSALGSGKNLIDASGSVYGKFELENCKLGASVGLTTGSVAAIYATRVRLVNCDSAATNYRYLYQDYAGSITQETTIVRSGGASNGTTPFSRKLVSTANSSWHTALTSDPVMVWNDSTSPVTVSIPILNDGVTLTTADIWVEVEYLGDASTPQASFASGAAATVLTAGSSWDTDSSSTWTTTGLSSPVQQLLSVTFTPAMIGPLQVRVYLARPSTTVYVDPKVQVS